MKKFSNNKEIDKEVKIKMKSGWRFRSGKKHGILVSPSGRKLAIPSTPSDYRAFNNFKSDLNKMSQWECKYNG